MHAQHDPCESTPFVADVDTNETIENCVKQFQATAAELFASLIQRVHLLDRDMDQPVSSQDRVTNDEARRVGEQHASTACSLETTLHEIRGQLERVNSHLNRTSEPICDTFKGGSRESGQRP